jgi:hypothetical protein
MYETVIPFGRVYIVESQYTFGALAEWSSKHARMNRALHPDGPFALPAGPKGDFKPVEILSLRNVRPSRATNRFGIGSAAYSRLVTVDKQFKLRARCPEVRIVPVEDVIILVGGGIPQYKAIVPLTYWNSKSTYNERQWRKDAAFEYWTLEASDKLINSQDADFPRKEGAVWTKTEYRIDRRRRKARQEQLRAGQKKLGPKVVNWGGDKAG